MPCVKANGVGMPEFAGATADMSLFTGIRPGASRFRLDVLGLFADGDEELCLRGSKVGVCRRAGGGAELCRLRGLRGGHTFRWMPLVPEPCALPGSGAGQDSWARFGGEMLCWCCVVSYKPMSLNRLLETAKSEGDGMFPRESVTLSADTACLPVRNLAGGVSLLLISVSCEGTHECNDEIFPS